MVAESPGESFVRSVTEIESHGKDIGRSVCQLVRGLGETPCLEVLHHWPSGRRSKCVGKVGPGHAAGGSDRIQANRPRRIALNDPKGLIHNRHTNAQSDFRRVHTDPYDRALDRKSTPAKKVVRIFADPRGSAPVGMTKCLWVKATDGRSHGTVSQGQGRSGR